MSVQLKSILDQLEESKGQGEHSVNVLEYMILERLQYKYEEYSRKYKQQQLKNKPVKVWYGINKI